MSANTDSASQDVPSVSSPGAEPVSKPKGKTLVEPTAMDIIPAKPNYNHEFAVEKAVQIADRGLPKGSVEPRTAPTAEPATPGVEDEVPFPPVTEYVQAAIPLRSIEFIDISGDVSPEATPLVKRPRRSETTLEIESSQRVETILEVEVTAATDPSSSADPAIATEVLPTADTARAVPASPPAPSSRPDNLDDMLAGTPPATAEASGFGHLHIPRATRVANRSTETGARSKLVDIFPAPSVEPRRTRSVVVTVPEDCSFLSRPVGVASYLRPLISDSDKEKMEGLPWQCLINEGMHAGNRSVVLVNEGFIRAQREVEDLKGQLDAQSRETEKFKLLLQEKEDQLSRAVPPPNLQSELEAAKADNLRLKAELDDAVEKNRLLEQDNINLGRDNANFATRLGEFEATIAQLRGELNSIKADAEKAAEKFHQLETERATEREKLRVLEEKVETRARAVDELKSKLEEATAANDLLQTELESVNQVRITLLEAKFELEENLKKAEADLEESLKDMEAAEAHTTLSIEYERWKSRRVTLEQVERGLGDIRARILEAKAIEDKAKKALDASSDDDSEKTVSEDSGSNHTG
ncbi:uncharacterized protein LOC132049014 [Lycium ferocissimum]|uniref:uncharacterized protein LOC132049014 n=1 Tax=Lycium ferocissimum TaxID=112874 RepID=UPI0028151D64|nr:uncharacterized protein LOC132049014 [Lycium ferocissimum]